jgi:hypothetical protein
MPGEFSGSGGGPVDGLPEVESFEIPPPEAGSVVPLPSAATPPPTDGGPSYAAQVIAQKHAQYRTASRWYRCLYYATRLVAGLAAVAIPFTLGHSQTAATTCAIIVAVCTVFDTVFDPKSRWQRYSRATDLLAIAELKRRNEYDRYKDELEVAVATEAANVEKLENLQAVLKQIQERPQAATQ